MHSFETQQAAQALHNKRLQFCFAAEVCLPKLGQPCDDSRCIVKLSPEGPVTCHNLPQHLPPAAQVNIAPLIMTLTCCQREAARAFTAMLPWPISTCRVPTEYASNPPSSRLLPGVAVRKPSGSSPLTQLSVHWTWSRS